MKRTLLVAATALALSAPAVPHAHAAELTVGAPAQAIDIRRHIVVMDGGADDARFKYAKIVCRPRLGAEAWAPGSVLPPGYVACLKSQGFAWVLDSPAQIAAREKAAQGERNRETLYAIGDALIQTGAALQPHGCNGQVQSNGYFSTRCY